MNKLLMLTILSMAISCNTQGKKNENQVDKTDDIAGSQSNAPFIWEAANIYFLLTDRFNNADPSNDVNFKPENREITGL